MKYLPKDLEPFYNKLSEDGKIAFNKHFDRSRKSLTTAYIGWLFGCHYACIGKWGTQVLFWITAGGFFIWWILDLFFLPFAVTEINRKIAYDVLGKIKNLES